MTQNAGNQRDAERYVAGTLTGEEGARFEEAMIAHPELAADVSVRRRIKAGLSQLEQNHELEALLKEVPRRPNYLRYAAAASVLVVVAAGLMTFWNRETPPLRAFFNASDMGAKPVPSFTLAIQRSGDVPVLEIQRDAGPVELRIFVDAAATPPFTARLTSGQTGTSAIGDSSISQLTDGFAVLYLEPRELQSGDYTLALEPASGDEQLFPFKLHVLP